MTSRTFIRIALRKELNLPGHHGRSVANEDGESESAIVVLVSMPVIFAAHRGCEPRLAEGELSDHGLLAGGCLHRKRSVQLA
jgi:hypothetical protein